jgi:hypothetical protein
MYISYFVLSPFLWTREETILLNKTYKIYACELDGEVIYVGKTGRTFEARIRDHRTNPFAPVYRRLQESKGAVSHWKILEFCAAEEVLAREQYWIDHYKKISSRMVNTDDATIHGRPKECSNPRGEAHYAYKNPAAVEKAVRASAKARKGKPLSEEVKENMRKAHSSRIKKDAKPVMNVKTKKVYSSAREASLAYGWAPGTVATSIARQSFRDGIKWRYIE